MQLADEILLAQRNQLEHLQLIGRRQKLVDILLVDVNVSRVRVVDNHTKDLAFDIVNIHDAIGRLVHAIGEQRSKERTAR